MYKVVIDDASSAKPDLPLYIVANTQLGDYRATLTAVSPNGETLALAQNAAAALKLKAGGDVRAVALSVADRT